MLLGGVSAISSTSFPREELWGRKAEMSDTQTGEKHY
jgi:hypothetical protein